MAAQSPAAQAASTKRRVFDIDPKIRELNNAYRRATRKGEDVTEEMREAHREFERARWRQVPEHQRKLEAKLSNETRTERERIFGRIPANANPRQRATVKLILKYRKEFERMLRSEERADERRLA